MTANRSQEKRRLGEGTVMKTITNRDKKQKKKVKPAFVCPCSRVGSGSFPDYDLPPGHEINLKGNADIDGHWENIRICVLCGQYWHQATICGHANVVTFEKITPAQREAILAERWKDQSELK
jgi:hypothetical protein